MASADAVNWFFFGPSSYAVTSFAYERSHTQDHDVGQMLHAIGVVQSRFGAIAQMPEWSRYASRRRGVRSALRLRVVLLALAVQRRDIDTEDRRGVLECWRAGDHALDVLALELIDREVAAETR
jgi:hypothetical protein